MNKHQTKYAGDLENRKEKRLVWLMCTLY